MDGKFGKIVKKIKNLHKMLDKVYIIWYTKYSFYRKQHKEDLPMRFAMSMININY